MTTKRQVKKLLAPLLARHPDIALVENDLGMQFVLRPLRHINRGFMIWPTGRADWPRRLAALPLVSGIHVFDPQRAL